MRIRPVVLALTAIAVFPSLAFCQSQQYVNCHTPESSGNFVGSNETIVNGSRGILEPMCRESTGSIISKRHR